MLARLLGAPPTPLAADEPAAPAELNGSPSGNGTGPPPRARTPLPLNPRAGLVDRVGEGVRLTPRGRMLGGAVTAELLA